jgi:hypothetical protein
MKEVLRMTISVSRSSSVTSGDDGISSANLTARLTASLAIVLRWIPRPDAPSAIEQTMCPDGDETVLGNG